jgi:hypothetical protein
MIRSLAVVHHRLIVGGLVDRGISLFRISEGAAVSIVGLRRLMEFASPLGAEEAGRLVSWSTKMILISRPKPARSVRSVSAAGGRVTKADTPIVEMRP